MKIREEKNGNFWIFCTGMMLWYFMSGIEYGIILANINDYLLKGFGSKYILQFNVRARFYGNELWITSLIFVRVKPRTNGSKLASWLKAIQNWPRKPFVYHQNLFCFVENFQKFRARNSLFLHEFEPKESRRATKVNWICIYIFRFFWAHIITNLRVNMHWPMKSHSDGFINYLKYKINLYASKTSFWLFFWNFNFNFTRFFEIFKFEFLTEF